MFKLTKSRAMEIQSDQVNHYAKQYGEHVRKLVSDATTADQLEYGIEYDVVIVNRHIPRGGAIAQLIPEIVAQEAAIKARHEAWIESERNKNKPRKGIY